MGRGLVCTTVRFSRHAMERMFQRGIPPEAVAHALETGEVIQDYPDDTPYPSALILGFWKGEPVHVVAAQEPDTQRCFVITVYTPMRKVWDDEFKMRRRP